MSLSVCFITHLTFKSALLLLARRHVLQLELVVATNARERALGTFPGHKSQTAGRFKIGERCFWCQRRLSVAVTLKI